MSEWYTEEHFKKDKGAIEKSLEKKLPYEIELDAFFSRADFGVFLSQLQDFISFQWYFW